MAIDTIFKNIADAIREKAGTSGLITPAQMPQAIADIPTGGSGLVAEEPLSFDYNICYISGDGYCRYANEGTYYNDIYYLKEEHLYVLYKSALSSMFRCAIVQNNPVSFPGQSIRAFDLCNATDTNVRSSDNRCYIMTANNPSYSGYYHANIIRRPSYADTSYNYPYLVVTKTKTNQANIKTYLFDVTSLT